MTLWHMTLSLALFALAGCAGYTSIEKKLEPSLACKGFVLYFPEEGSWRPYQKKIPADPDDWEEALAVLTYDETIAHQTYVYRLTYRAKDAELNQIVPHDDTQDDEDGGDDEEQDKSGNDNDSSTDDSASKEDEKASEDTPKTEPTLVQITHFLKTTLRFPRFQHVRIRYFRYAPLLFEWTSPLRVCPFL
jgi:hypothetical protein